MLLFRIIKLLFTSTFALIAHLATLYGQSGFIKGTPEIAYWKIGDKPQTIIVVHGGPGAAHNYMVPEWNALSEIATVIYYDQRGTGKSERSECYSWSEHVGDLKRLIDQTCSGKEVIIAGSSWGSTLALLYGYKFPQDVKGLILSGTYNWVGHGQPYKDCSEYRPYPLRLIKDSGNLKSMTVIDENGGVIQTSKTIEVNHVSHSMTNKSMASAPTLQELAKIKLPTLIFKGTGNCKMVLPKEGADLYLTVIPNSKLGIIDGACHDPWITHTKQFFEMCIAFVRLLK